MLALTEPFSAFKPNPQLMDGELPRSARGLAARPELPHLYGTRIRTLTANWNENPELSVRHKTCCEILERLAAYCERMPVSER